MAVRELSVEGYRSIRALRFSLAPVRPLSGAAERREASTVRLTKRDGATVVVED